MKRSDNRLRFLYALMIMAALAVIINIGFVTIGKVHLRSRTSLVNYISSVSNVEENIFASRGVIYDSSGAIIAQDVQTYDIICYLDPNRLASGDQIAYVDNPGFAAEVLAPILNMESKDIYDILTSNTHLYQIELGANGRNLSKEQRDQILSIKGLNGIDFRNSYKRYYPYGEAFCPQLVGFAKSDNTGKLVGRMGVEEYLDDELSGTDGFHSYQMDKNGYTLPGMYDKTIEAINGYDVYLTLDVSIQEAINTAIETTIEYKDASRVWAAVVEVKTGRILGWGQYPSFDPNNITTDDVQVNFGAQLAYEPGSVMKSIIYSAAMDMGVYDNAYFDSSPYCYTASTGRTYGGSGQLGCINNVDNKNWGMIPLDYGLIYSSNVATATLLSQYVGVDGYEDYIHRFHLYEKVNSDGISEVTGLTNYGNSPVDDITATYGQGSSTTMLQLLQAYTAIFGNGEMLKPYIIDKIVDPNSDTLVYKGGKKSAGTPISSETARAMQDLLRRVVSDPEGTCRHYAAKSVEVMGKTGTSEIPLDGEYSEDENIISCMLGFPYEDPQYMVYFAYVSPKTLYYNYEVKPIPDLIDRIAALENISFDENGNGPKFIEEYDMPKLLSKKTGIAKEEFEAMDLNVIVIGDGDNVIGQYPSENSKVYSGHKVFLLTDGRNIAIPDFTGWSRKEVINYWNLSKLSIVMDGYGVAYAQSIAPYSIVDSSTTITISFREINYTEHKDEQNNPETENHE